MGYGYWGPNLVRNVIERPELELATLCERDHARAAAFLQRVPDGRSCRLRRVLDDRRSTPCWSPPRRARHHALAVRRSEAGKHVLVEKPLARTVAEAEDLIELAEANERVLMPGHTFLYSPPVNKVRELIRQGALGEVYFVTSSRMNLGKYQPDGVICDLGAARHLDPALPDRPADRAGQRLGAEHLPRAQPEVAFLTLTFEGGVTANVQISWLAPRKVREMVIVGSQRMVQYDDTAADESVRVFDRGMDFKEPENFGEHQLSYRSRRHRRPARRGGRAAQPRAAGLRRAIRTGRRAALARPARARDGRGDRGGGDLAAAGRRAGRARAGARARGRLSQRAGDGKPGRAR